MTVCFFFVFGVRAYLDQTLFLHSTLESKHLFVFFCFIVSDGIDLGTSVDEARHSEIAYSDIYVPNGQANKDNTLTQPSSKSCCVIC